MICFDLEGPLSPQDNAYEVLKLARNGGLVFETLSGYDDVLAMKNREGYEPGDTLKLIVPFLVYYGITGEDIKRVSSGAGLVRGMKETIDYLKERNVPVRVISTSYQQHAYTIGRRLGIPEKDIASTRLDIKKLYFDEETLESLGKAEGRIISEGLTDETIKMLDELYFTSGLFEGIEVSVVGGQRKVEALNRFAEEAGRDVSEVAAIGDSITDYKMLREVSRRGGLAIAFNTNKYCLPHADVSVAAVDGRAILPVLDAFINGGRTKAIKRVGEIERNLKAAGEEFSYLFNMKPRPHYAVITKRRSLDDVLKAHMEMRMQVRGEAGRLG